jgi:hypothetical protein
MNPPKTMGTAECKDGCGYLPSSLVLGLCLRLFIAVLRFVSSVSVSRDRAGLGVVPLLPLLRVGELGREVAIS